MDRLVIADGKYTIVKDGAYLGLLRDGKPWSEKSLLGDKLVGALFVELQQAREKLNEVHSWIVCAAIASPEDMMQNAARIEEITRPSKS